MTIFHHQVDLSKSINDPLRVQQVAFTVEEEAARDAEEAAWAVEKAGVDDAQANKEALLDRLRTGNVEAADLQTVIADLLEGKV